MLPYLYVVLAIAARVLAGTGTLSLYGFTPLGASLLFFGSRMPRKQFWIPVALLIGTDVYLNFFRYHMALTWDQAVVWAWYAGACCIGMLLRGRVKALFVGGAAVGSSVSFFLISNFAVWLAGNIAYPKTLAGLGACFTAAIPFFRNDLISSLMFSAVFFAIPVLAGYAGQATEQKSAAA
ncbi:MAG TPA: DUF6580 family putative transport protein [Candidatus Angelobacter sp.]|nr:DUF6580 family putative transport protein [Candidatus Angelobacter sp.]